MNKTILIIDDDDDIREATQLCLEVVGNWEIITASSGKQGIEKAIVQQPNLILLDVMMPVMDGIQTLKKLKTNLETKNIPVIFLTAKAHPAEQRQYTQLDIIEVITKPYDPFELSDRIAKVLA